MLLDEVISPEVSTWLWIRCGCSNPLLGCVMALCQGPGGLGDGLENWGTAFRVQSSYVRTLRACQVLMLANGCLWGGRPAGLQ